MSDRYMRNESGLCINTDNAPYNHIMDRRAINARIQRLESDVGGIANSISQLIDMIQRGDKKKLERSEED